MWGLHRRVAVGLSASLVSGLVAAGGVPAAADGDAAAASAVRVEVEAASVHWRTGRPAGWTGAQEMSDDGRMVLMFSTASTLIPDPPRGRFHLYVRDRVAGTTRVVTSRSDGTPAPGLVWDGMGISGDGRFAAFSWRSRKLSPTGKHPRRYVYVKNLRSGELDAIRARGSGMMAGYRVLDLNVQGISRHGRYVTGTAAFAAPSGTKVVAFLLDRRTNASTWICPGARVCHVGELSDNGRYLTYYFNPG